MSEAMSSSATRTMPMISFASSRRSRRRGAADGFAAGGGFGGAADGAACGGTAADGAGGGGRRGGAGDGGPGHEDAARQGSADVRGRDQAFFSSASARVSKNSV